MSTNVNSVGMGPVNLVNENNQANVPAENYDFYKSGKAVLKNAAILSAAAAVTALAIAEWATQKQLSCQDWINWHDFGRDYTSAYHPLSILDYLNGGAVNQILCTTSSYRTLSFSDNMAFSIKWIQDTVFKFSPLVCIGLVLPVIVSDNPNAEPDKDASSACKKPII
jgi:hypothetical protein